MTDTIIRQLVSYISAIEASSTYRQDERLLRKRVVRTLIRLTDGKLNKYLSGQALSGIDLALFDFRGTDMADVDFSGSFMIECDFRGVNLSRSSFAGCRIRNVRFDDACLDGVDFTDADWFNALGLTASQFATSRISTLLASPVTEEELHAFLDQNYSFKFRSWGSRIQEELRHAWATYLQPGGLAGEVAHWAEPDRSVQEPTPEREADPLPSRTAQLKHDLLSGVGGTTDRRETLRPDTGTSQREETDFFVSYTSADRLWAEWIAWQLEEAGYYTAIQAWDSLPGRDFVKWMDQSIRSAKHVLVVLSPAYVQAASLAGPEWTTAIVRDPTGERAVLLPVRVADFNPGGLLGTRGWVDLVGKDEKAARAALLDGVRQRRLKPATKPPFPSRAAGSPSPAEEVGQLAPIAPPQPRFPGPDPFDRVRKAMRELDDQSERFRTSGPNAHSRRMFLSLTFFPTIRRSLDELACINPAKWPDPGWAVDFSATRSLAAEKLSRAEANRDGEPSREIMELLYVLAQLRQQVAKKYPQVLND